VIERVVHEASALLARRLPQVLDPQELEKRG